MYILTSTGILDVYIYKPNCYVNEVECIIFLTSTGILDVYIYKPNVENNLTYTLTLNLILNVGLTLTLSYILFIYRDTS